MGHPKNSTISQRKNISRTVTQKCHSPTNDCTPEEEKGSRNIEEHIGEGVWIDDDDDDDDDLDENAQQDVSSHSSSMAVLDSEEENDTPPIQFASLQHDNF